MSNPITPYFAISPMGNLVWVSEFNDESPSAEVKFLYTFRTKRREVNAGDVQVIHKRHLALVTAVSHEVAMNFLTIKLGGSNL